MKILSIYWGICSSASLFIDGKVVASVHEERFTRFKNDDSFPSNSIKYCLEAANISSSELDGAAIASFSSPIDDIMLSKSQWTIDDYLKEQHLRWKPFLVNGEKVLKSVLETFPEKKRAQINSVSEYFKNLENLPFEERQSKYDIDREQILAEFLSIDKVKVKRIEHHRCHAAYSYYASKYRNKPVLALTVDGWGDGKNATIGIFDEKGKYSQVYESDQCAIGRIYRYMTLMLGMKPNEHEFKVMGLAPYGKEAHAKKALDVLRNTLYVDGKEFKWKEKPKDSYFWFKERFEGIRFDNIAFALQKWTEELLVEWVRNTINNYKIHDIVISGGVAMNIKAMGKIADLPEVKSLFVGGSASDESMAISSGICLAEDLTNELSMGWNSNTVEPLTRLYLGPSASLKEEQRAVGGLDEMKFEIIESPENDHIAKILFEGKILARAAGRMEFGQRALGNRSILADPIHLKIKEKINSAIKSRDFWMPFAPVVMDIFSKRYLLNPKDLESPHMTLSFDTTEEGYNAMSAACHPADRTARAQILKEHDNPELYSLLKAFERLTGRGALLNTSFNLHGFPIVNTPLEAIDVLMNSGLDGLILNHFLILKK
ncbi:carbamoyltransferase C-terminal domain-containing protein [Leptospira santarosai]|uniref:Carbamoyltransferase n=1 Tax=Leptospira santarosai str. ZUN179 TaxID=1049985 RepID=M6UKZ0_9LEPT|nr:carbamoyltransferase C-terminal domain-containing protein [Leptospira santarosai]EMO45787.1 carbamoyltransferase [Leptospira santarosai str. ZUN179]MDI7217524.1 carbamoyltransferase C-terminal domain-containing protein [Leptospira santarosai]